jgi:pilus assembly protein CpaF
MELEDQLKGDAAGAGSARLIERIQTQAPQEPTFGDRRPDPGIGAGDPYGALKTRVQRAVIGKLGPRLFGTAHASGDVRRQVTEAVAAELERERETTPLANTDMERLTRELTADILGYGPLEPYLAEDDVTEIMVNGYNRIYVERRGVIEETTATFVDDDHLLRIIDKIVSQVGRRVDESSPMVDARLPDGSRVNAIIGPLSLLGPTLTIRKFSRDPYTMADLIGFNSLTEKAAHFLEACVEGKLNVLISGGTGTGKTTMLNALSAYIPEAERIVTIEDAAELQLQQEHWVRLESRPPNIEGEGEVKIRELVRNALRMRPDRIVVGEVRGAETLDMLQAMNTGHEGSLTTIHANSPRDALNRLETMVLMSGIQFPLKAIREQVASALDMIVHLTRLVDGSRRVQRVTEVIGMESDVVTLQDVFLARPMDERAAATGDPGVLLRPLEPSGLQPHFRHKLAAQGVEIPEDFYRPERTVVAVNGGWNGR